MSGVPASNSCGPAPAADEVRAADQRFQGVRGRRPAPSTRSSPRRGAVRGMSSFHEAFHGSASEPVHSRDSGRFMQVKRGAPGRIRTCASGDLVIADAFRRPTWASCSRAVSLATSCALGFIPRDIPRRVSLLTISRPSSCLAMSAYSLMLNVASGSSRAMQQATIQESLVDGASVEPTSVTSRGRQLWRIAQRAGRWFP